MIEIADRNETLEEKKKRIMELKKKIQELEKFKFVLNYKIKELKREIGPSSIQIVKLNEQVSKMKSELKHFDRVNKNLVLIVDDMRMRQEGLKKELSTMTKRLAEQQAEKRRVEDNVVDVFTHGIGDFKKLKRAVVRLYRSWVQEERALMEGGASETDTKQFYM